MRETPCASEYWTLLACPHTWSPFWPDAILDFLRARIFQTNFHHHNESVLSIFYTMRRATLSRISLHTIITLWVLYCMCIGHFEDHPSSVRVSWDNVTQAIHNLAIRKPVTATFSCTRKTEQPSENFTQWQAPFANVDAHRAATQWRHSDQSRPPDSDKWTHFHVATVYCMLVGRCPALHVTAATYGFISLVQTWALVPTTSSRTLALLGHVIDAIVSTSPVADSTHMRLKPQIFSIHYLPFLSILLIGASLVACFTL